MSQEGREVLEVEEAWLRNQPPSALCPPAVTGGVRGEKSKERGENRATPGLSHLLT